MQAQGNSFFFAVKNCQLSTFLLKGYLSGVDGHELHYFNILIDEYEMKRIKKSMGMRFYTATLELDGTNFKT